MGTPIAPGGISGNRHGTLAVQVCLVGYTAKGFQSDKQLESLKALARWLRDEHRIPMRHVGDGTRSTHNFNKDGWVSHKESPGNDHTDGPPHWDWLDDDEHAGHAGHGGEHAGHGGEHHRPAPSDTDHYRVLVSHDGHTVPVLNADHGSWTLDPAEATKYPHGRLHRDRVDEAIRWAGEQHHPLVRVERARPATPHPDHAARAAHEGRLTLRDGAHWPTDHRTIHALKQVAHDLGVEVRIISGLRTRAEQERLYYGWVHRLPGFNLAARPGTSNHERGHAADVDVVKSDGSLVSIGNYPGARAALKRHGLALSVRTEPWHVDPQDVAPWANPPIPR
jgi:hypothetical protein